MKPWFGSQTLFHSGFVDFTLCSVPFGASRRLIDRYAIRFVVGDPQLSVTPIQKVDNPLHHLPITPWHDERNFTTEDLRGSQSCIGFRSTEGRKKIVHGILNRFGVGLFLGSKDRPKNGTNLSS